MWQVAIVVCLEERLRFRQCRAENDEVVHKMPVGKTVRTTLVPTKRPTPAPHPRSHDRIE